MDESEFRNLCESHGVPYEEDRFYEDQLIECGEIRWRENNRAINLRNYEERPEDYR